MAIKMLQFSLYGPFAAANILHYAIGVNKHLSSMHLACNGVCSE